MFNGLFFCRFVTARRLSFGASRTGFYPSLNLRSTFAQPSLNLRSTFAQPSLNLRSRFALNRFIENVGVIAN